MHNFARYSVKISVCVAHALLCLIEKITESIQIKKFVKRNCIHVSENSPDCLYICMQSI